MSIPAKTHGGATLLEQFAGGYKEQATVTVTIRSLYGRPVAYPACPRAELFAELQGTKTLTKEALAVIERLGFQVVSQSELRNWMKVCAR